MNLDESLSPQLPSPDLERVMVELRNGHSVCLAAKRAGLSEMRYHDLLRTFPHYRPLVKAYHQKRSLWVPNE